jgi:hypothetical protein
MHLPSHILEAAVISRLGIAVERTVEDGQASIEDFARP